MTEKKKFVSPFENMDFRNYFEEIFLKRRLAPLSVALRDKNWLERLKKEEPKEDVKELIKVLTRKHNDLEKKYLQLQTARMKRTSGKHRFAHAMVSERVIDSFVLRNEDRNPVYDFLFGCYQTGVQQMFTIVDPGRSKFSVNKGSTESHRIFQRLDVPAAVQFEINIKDVAKWWRWDASDHVWLINDVYFPLPPSPCNGRLGWQSDVLFTNHLFHHEAEWVEYSVSVSSTVLQTAGQRLDTSNVEYCDNVFPTISGGPTQAARYGPIVQFGGSFDVTRGQQSLIVFTIAVFLAALDGRMEVAGTVGFNDSMNPGNWTSAAGVRYTFVGS